MMTTTHLDKQPIPEGFQVFEQHFEISGLHHRYDEVEAFIRSRSHVLELKIESSNPHDKNAIAVQGVYRYFFGMFSAKPKLGYVPASIAKRLTKTGLASSVRPRLIKTWLGDRGGAEILMQLIGPKAEISRYRK